MLDYSKSFIETQFPVSKISKESYKERKAGASQTLTPLGKWWGRKPLILVRTTLLGLLMPISDNPVKDREIFLKILTMDEDGLWMRKSKSIPPNDVFISINESEKIKYFTVDSTEKKAKYRSSLTKEEKDFLQKLSFNRLSYDQKLKYCNRPEQYNLIDEDKWSEINEHLETNASNLQELIEQLGNKRYGHRPRVGDAFAGGGSIPFESARIGADVYASDLNPVAMLLNWASLNIASASDKEFSVLKNFQEKIYQAVDKQVIDWGVEHNEKGDRADSYLYCNEAECPECGYTVPLAPSWVIGRKSKTVALLHENSENGFDIDIVSGATKDEILRAESLSTVKNSRLRCPHCGQETPVASIRGDYDDGVKRKYGYSTPNTLRKWEKRDFIGREEDVFRERLYAIRYVGEKERYYVAPSSSDLNREKEVVRLLSERIYDWQKLGYIPSTKIDEGDRTNEPMMNRGWQYWHHLFNPRQLLVTGLFAKYVNELATSQSEITIGLLGINKVAEWNSKLCIWDASREDKGKSTFLNQAMNTLYNYSCRGLISCESNWYTKSHCKEEFKYNKQLGLVDARAIDKTNDIWITDPPYADAVYYHELTEFFLAWDKTLIEKGFSEWYTDSKRVLAVKGVGQEFNNSMIDVYKNLAEQMPDNGYQVVMFTHQDVKVWSELSMILWSAGLQVVSAWNIATETESGGLKDGGNYVKGTVILTLKKQLSDEIAFQDELYDEIKYEVTTIIDSMRELDDKDDPDFTDADYLLASYASTLKILTKYKEIEGIDIPYWLSQSRNSKEANPVEELINKAVRIAYDYLIPEGFEKGHWVDLRPEERFFIRGLELEMNGTHKISSYQELARGFGVSDYKGLFAEFKANSARLKTPSDYRMTQLGGTGFGNTLLRYLLVAIYETTKSQSTQEGRTFLKDAYKEDNQYWYKKPLMIELLGFIANLEFVSHMEHWHEHARSAKILKEALRNEGV